MSTFAWFDISTTNNTGFTDAKHDDVLIRCLNPSQKFLFGATGQSSSFIVNTNGTASIRSNIQSPLFTTNRIIPLNNYIQLADAVFVQEGTVECETLNVSSIFTSNIDVHPGGYIQGADFIKTASYTDSPYTFTNTISKSDPSLSAVTFTDNISMLRNLTVNNLINSENIMIESNISTAYATCLVDLTSPVIYTSTLSNNRPITIQGVQCINSNLTGSVLNFHNCVTHSNTSFTTHSTFSKSSNIDTYSISNSGSDTVYVQDVTIVKGDILCDNADIKNRCVINGSAFVNATLSVSSNLYVNSNIYCSNNITSDRINCAKASIPEIKTSLIYSENGNITINNGGVLILGGCNLHTTNAFFKTTTTSNINTTALTTSDITVIANASIGNNLTVGQIITTQKCKTHIIETNYVNDVFFETSNISVPGTLTASNIVMNLSCIMKSGGSFINYSPLLQYNSLVAYSNIKCYQEFDTFRLKTETIISPQQKIYIDDVLIQNKNHMILEKTTMDMLYVQKHALVGQANITTSLTVGSDIECKNIMYGDFLKGYNKSGDLKIEDILISDHSTMTLQMINVHNVNVSNGSIVLQENSSIMTSDNKTIIDINGRIDGSIIVDQSITSSNLAKECISSDKIAPNSVLSSHLSSGLVFTGTCKFQNIDLNGNLNTLDNSIVICGVTCSNSMIGLGGIRDPIHTMHVNGTSLVEYRNYSVFNGMSNNMGVLSMKSTHIETPLSINMSYNNVCRTSFSLATYPSSFGVTSIEQGDLMIRTINAGGSVSKIYINESIVVSSSNVGIWKSSPLAPLHTTILASDKIGVGGVVAPIETIDLIGNIRAIREMNASSCFFKMLDVDYKGVTFEFGLDKIMRINNEKGDIVLNALDNDPSKCNHIRVQSTSGYIGFGTQSPLAPLHINGVVRPGATVSEHTVIIEAKNPSVKLQGAYSTCLTSINANGQYIFQQTTGNMPYIAIPDTDRIFRENCDIVIGASDNILVLGPYTKLVMFTENNQYGLSETLKNDSHVPVSFSITGPLRITNWATEIKSIALSTTNTMVHKIISDILYTNYKGDRVLYIDNSIKLLGIGTDNPRGGIDIHSSFTTNVICYKGVCVMDTGFNLKNINRLDLKGPFVLNGYELFDRSNNLLGINNINYSASLIHKGVVLIDNDRNIRNINSVFIKGPFYMRDKMFFDLNDNLVNIKNIYISGSILSNDRVFLDPNMNVLCNDIGCNDLVVLGVISANKPVIIEDAGSIHNVDNVLTISPISRACFVDSVQNKVLTVNVIDNSIEIMGDFLHTGQILIDKFRNMRNINGFTAFGPFVLNNRTVITSDHALDVINLNVDNIVTHKGVVILDANKNLTNISTLSCRTPIYTNNMVLIDADMNIGNIQNASVVSLDIQQVRFKCLTPKALSIECDALLAKIGGRTLLELTGIALHINTACILESVNTGRITSDSGLQLVTSAGSAVSTNVGYKSPAYVFGESLFTMRVSGGSVLAIESGPPSLPKQLFSITPSDTTITNKVIIGAPKETMHMLSVGGTIYADDDIFSFSDMRDKKHVRKIGGALRRLNAITGVLYERRGRRCTGVLAQDVQRVLPEAVYTDDVTGNMSVAYGNMIGLLVESIKELNKQSKRRIRISGLQKRRQSTVN